MVWRNKWLNTWVCRSGPPSVHFHFLLVTSTQRALPHPLGEVLLGLSIKAPSNPQLLVQSDFVSVDFAC